MAREIPEVVRAAAGLVATVLDEARKLPETLPGLPVRVLGLAMQQAMKVQQQYAGLVARGDELFTGLRGENEPGLATFDDEPEPAPSNGYRESAFDRAGDSFTATTVDLDETLTDAEVEALPGDPAADAVTAVVDELADQVETGRQSIEELVDEAPALEEILEEIAIDELVEQAPTLEETAPGTPALSVVEDAPTPAPVEAEPTADVATTVDVVTPDGEIASVEAAVTDEGIAAPEAPEADTPAGEDDTVATTDGAADATPTDATTTDAAAGDTAAEPPASGTKARKAAKPRKAAKATSAKSGRSGKGDKATDTTATTDTAATDTAATETNAGPATATDEGGSAVAAATGVRTDVGTSDTAEEDNAIAEGAAVDAVGEASTAPTDDPEGASELSGSQAAGTAPIEGYDGFSIAQLRGRLRGYALTTVQDLVSYEEATRAREPYLRLLRNRLEKLEEQAVEASPLAPRGA
jgi:hypothetical protein